MPHVNFYEPHPYFSGWDGTTAPAEERDENGKPEATGTTERKRTPKGKGKDKKEQTFTAKGPNGNVSMSRSPDVKYGAASHRPLALAGLPPGDSGTSPSLQKLDQAIQEGNEKTEIGGAINVSKMSQCGHTYCAKCSESSLRRLQGKCPLKCSGDPLPLVKGMTANIHQTLRDQEQRRQQEAYLSGIQKMAVQETYTLYSEREGDATINEAVGGTDTQGAAGFTYENASEAVTHANVPTAAESSDSNECGGNNLK